MEKKRGRRAVAKRSSANKGTVRFPAYARVFSTHLLDSQPATQLTSALEAAVASPAPVFRKSADALTQAEQDVFKSAVTKAIADGSYSRLVDIHADMTHDMHTMSGMPAGTLRFLPWHRVYLVKFEQAMRAFEPTFALPYWRWMDQTDIPAWMQNFKPSGVTDANGNSIPVTRDSGGDPSAPNLPTTSQILTTVMNQNNYRSFTLALEGARPFGAHNLVHGPTETMRGRTTAWCCDSTGCRRP